MSKEELERELEAIQKVVDAACQSRESALQFLVDAGIATPSGELAEPYR